MYHILVWKNKIMYQTASDRSTLNFIADKLDDELNGYLPYEGVDEERDYGDGELSYDEFIKQNPKYKNYKLCKTAKEFIE